MASKAKQTILVTGAGGLVGRRLIARLAAAGNLRVRAAVRDLRQTFPAGVEPFDGLDVRAAGGWKEALRDADCVIHCAARVHIMKDSAVDPLAEFRSVNRDGTANLAGQAVRAGVKRFVFLSTIAVNGANSDAAPFRPGDAPAPDSAYAVSKHEAETGLRALAAKSGLELVIIRPPLIYGPGVGGNFATMMQWLKKGIPLPLGAVRNRRSLVAVDNLTDLIAVSIAHPRAPGGVLLVSDDDDVSTPQLLKRLGQAMGKTPVLLPVPPRLLEFAAAALGRRDMAQRLLGSLHVDISGTMELLQWKPPVRMDQGLKLAAAPPA